MIPGGGGTTPLSSQKWTGRQLSQGGAKLTWHQLLTWRHHSRGGARNLQSKCLCFLSTNPRGACSAQCVQAPFPLACSKLRLDQDVCGRGTSDLFGRGTLILTHCVRAHPPLPCRKLRLDQTLMFFSITQQLLGLTHLDTTWLQGVLFGPPDMQQA